MDFLSIPSRWDTSVPVYFSSRVLTLGIFGIVGTNMSTAHTDPDDIAFIAITMEALLRMIARCSRIHTSPVPPGELQKSMDSTVH